MAVACEVEDVAERVALYRPRLVRVRVGVRVWVRVGVSVRVRVGLGVRARVYVRVRLRVRGEEGRLEASAIPPSRPRPLLARRSVVSAALPGSASPSDAAPWGPSSLQERSRERSAVLARMHVATSNAELGPSPLACRVGLGVALGSVSRVRARVR